MATAAVLAVISFLGIMTAVAWIAYVSWGIHRDDRRAQLRARITPSRASRYARHATGVHGFGAQS